MSMILAKRKGDWLLAAFAPHIRGCNLSTNRVPREDIDEFHVWRGNIRVWSHAPIDGITFYPEIRYKGCGGRPVMWKADSTEPILYCEIGTPPGWSRQQQEANISELEAEGWNWDRRDGVGRGYVHVEDLEKVEGPPPERAF
jgi:hypothetical protein